MFDLILRTLRKLLNKLEGPLTEAEVDAKFADLASQSSEKLDDWQGSIIDMMKLLKLDSSLANRKQLAKEFGYTGSLDGSPAMNLWLAKEFRRRIAVHDADSLRD